MMLAKRQVILAINRIGLPLFPFGVLLTSENVHISDGCFARRASR
jgi:hypothetical protein